MSSSKRQAAKLLVEVSANVQVRTLSVAHTAFINARIAIYKSPFTRHVRASTVKQLLRHLVKYHGADEGLVQAIATYRLPKPRNVTATKDERTALMSKSGPALRCWLLLCSDLAIRSGTAALLSQENYDKRERTLTFQTKYANRQVLPVTSELAELLDTCQHPAQPFVAQLARGKHWRGGATLQPIGRMTRSALYDAFTKVKKECGITRQLTPHDLRRTTARIIYKQTGDMRLAQALLGHSHLGSTVWYLQDATQEVSISALELAKLNPLTEKTQ